MHHDLTRRTHASTVRATLGKWLLAKPNWWIQFTIVAAVSLAGLMALGTWTYTSAPPRVPFVSSTTGKELISLDQILRGQELFHIRGLMSWGSFWGDGAERGPDFTADALHRTVVSMRSFYEQELEKEHLLTQADRDAITVRVQREIKENRYDEASGMIRINDAQLRAYEDLQTHYTRMFTDHLTGLVQPRDAARFELSEIVDREIGDAGHVPDPAFSTGDSSHRITAPPRHSHGCERDPLPGFGPAKVHASR